MRINKQKRGKVSKVRQISKLKKGQAALEFLMTYGWAILVVMIVIGALAYFGVLNPTIMLPEKCTLQMGLYCKDHLISIAPVENVDPKEYVNNSIYLKLENGMGKGIIITEMNVTGDLINCGVIASDATSGSLWNDNYNGNAGIHIDQGDDRTIMIDGTGSGGSWKNCSIISKIGKTKGDIRIRWYYDDATPTFTHTMSGELLAVVEDTT